MNLLQLFLKEVSRPKPYVVGTPNLHEYTNTELVGEPRLNYLSQYEDIGLLYRTEGTMPGSTYWMYTPLALSLIALEKL